MSLHAEEGDLGLVDPARVVRLESVLSQGMGIEGLRWRDRGAVDQKRRVGRVGRPQDSLWRRLVSELSLVILPHVQGGLGR